LTYSYGCAKGCLRGLNRTPNIAAPTRPFAERPPMHHEGLLLNGIDALEGHLRQSLLALLNQLEPEPAITAADLAFAAVPEGNPGDVALPCFALRGRLSALPPAQRNNPMGIAQRIADVWNSDPVVSTAVAAGPYVNFTYATPTLARTVVTDVLSQNRRVGGGRCPKPQHIVIEFSAPNTNKPQHLGHVRNNVLGNAVAKILAHHGHQVTKVNLVNDRGIHICKSMLAYLRWGNDTTPANSGIKGDHLIGSFYVRFEQAFAEEFQTWLDGPEGQAAFATWNASDAGRRAAAALAKWHDDALAPTKKKGKRKAPPEPNKVFKDQIKDTYFNTISPLGKAARDLLLRWEQSDPEVLTLWRRLNHWVLEGFDATYQRMGIHFDRTYFESQTYQLGKAYVDEGLERAIFIRQQDGAVVFPLEGIGLTGEKIVLRSDGTSVYITQDLGTAIARYEELAFERMIYVVADEQNHHFNVLFGILGALRPQLAGACEHLAYGLVLLPHGRMKSREGAVVDADDLMQEMHALARKTIDERSAGDHYSDTPEEELVRRAEHIGLAGLKYYLLDVSPVSTMEFNPEQSIDMQGRTGAYCLMNYARTRSLLRKADENIDTKNLKEAPLHRLQSPEERKLLLTLAKWPETVAWAADGRDPSRIAEYLFNLSKAFAFIFTDRTNHPIATCTDPELRQARLHLVAAIGMVLGVGLDLLGIQTLEEM